MPYYNVLRMQGAKTSASSALGSFNSWYAIDGSGSNYITNSRWVSNVGTVGEWLQIDLPRLAMINKFILYTGNSADGVNITGNAIRNVDFQIKQNDAWITVSQTRNNSLTNPKITAQLDKFYLTDSVRLYFPIAEDNFRVFELEAYGRAVGKKAQGTTSKNLLKPFTSSEWNYTRPIVSMSPNKVVLDLDQSRTNELVIPAKPNTTYTLSGQTTGRVYIVQRVGNNDKAGTGYSNWNTINRTITTGSDVTGLRVSLTADGAGIFTYENIMVNEGATALPYQVYEQNMRQAVLKPKKNFFSVEEFDRKKVIGVGSTYMYYLTNLKPNTDYTLSTNAPYTSGNLANIYLNGSTTDSNGVKNGLTRTTKSSANGQLYILVRNDAELAYQKVLSGEYWIQIEEGSVSTPFQKYHGTNKAAVKVPQKNLIDPKLITLRAGTNAFTISGNRITFDATKQDYAGINYQVANDADFAGKTVTWSCTNRSPEVTPMLAYKPAGSESLTYIGADLTTNFKTMTIPAGATNIRFYVQNNANARGNFFIDGWQIEYGERTPYAPYKYGNKLAVLTQPKKNIFPTYPLYWEAGSITSSGQSTSLNNIRTKDFVPVEPSTQYIQSSNDTGKTIVFYFDSAKNFISTPNQYYRDGATFTTPANCAYIKFVLRDVDDDLTASVNDVGIKYLVQIEKGNVKTPYTKYVLGAKKAKY